MYFQLYLERKRVSLSPPNNYLSALERGLVDTQSARKNDVEKKYI